ncbi:MAG TPA: hypothetical protein VHY82_01275 [Acetobacteraceae bacterium]|jgi:hypothetical protein|nr:hypothetical protein [Acetobacteraceae bacterium]
MAAVQITRQDLDATRLQAEAGRTADAKQARRMLAVAMVLDGHSRLLAAQAGGKDRQTLRDWAFCRKLPGRTCDTHGYDGLYPANE